MFGISKAKGVKIGAFIGALGMAAAQWLSGDRNGALGTVFASLTSATAFSRG